MSDALGNLVIVKNLSKTFEVPIREKGLIGSIKSVVSPTKKSVIAVKNVTFNIKKGELIGFIGPNGAGKTTTLKMLSGLLFPTNGVLQVAGFEPWSRKNGFLKKIALVMGQKNQLWWDLPAIDTFELNREIYEISRNTYTETLEQLTTLLEVKDILTVPVRRLSLGQRMRLELVAALIHKPEILFLDEPTIGLDVIAQQKVRDFIFEYNRKNEATIVLTSHNMDDVMDLAHRVIVINSGELIFDGNIKDLVDQYVKEKVIHLYFSKETDFKLLDKIGRVKRINFPSAVLSVPRETVASAAAEILQNFPVADLTIEEEPVEEIVRKVFIESSNKTKKESKHYKK